MFCLLHLITQNQSGMLKITSNTAIYVLLSVPRTATSSYFPLKTSFQKLQFQHKIIFLVFFQFHIINNNKIEGVQFFSSYFSSYQLLFILLTFSNILSILFNSCEPRKQVYGNGQQLFAPAVVCDASCKISKRVNQSYLNWSQ